MVLLTTGSQTVSFGMTSSGASAINVMVLVILMIRVRRCIVVTG
jgi:hypothetical protein